MAKKIMFVIGALAILVGWLVIHNNDGRAACGLAGGNPVGIFCYGASTEQVNNVMLMANRCGTLAIIVGIVLLIFAYLKKSQA